MHNEKDRSRQQEERRRKKKLYCTWQGGEHSRVYMRAMSVPAVGGRRVTDEWSRTTSKSSGASWRDEDR